MSKSKNTRTQPEITPWKRWRLWLSRNEKILWFGLLVLIAPLFAFTGPVQSFFQPGPDTTVQRVYFGTEVTLADLKRASRFVEALRRVAPGALSGASELVLVQNGRDFGFDPYKYYLYKEKAARLGIRVSNIELAQRIQELWRETEASRIASEEILASPDSTNQQQQMIRFYQLRIEKQKELEERGAFDSEGWKDVVKRSGLPLRTFEEMLRDFFTVVKLQEYVASSVKVSPQEVYEEFKKDRQKRLLSWATWKPPAELSEKIAAELNDTDLKAYFDENSANFYRPLAVRASYVIVPEEHFKAEAEKNVTDKDLEEYYQSNKNDYRTSAISADEALFALRTEEEQKEFEEALFKPLEEVKDEVREKVIESKAKRDLNEFASNTLRQKLSPTDGSEAPGLETLKAEFPYLETGTSDFATRADAEKVFGEAYTSEVDRWFRELDPPPGSQEPAKKEVTPARWAQTVESGKIYYADVEVRPASQPSYDDVASEVREKYTKAKAIETLAEALEKKVSPDDAAAGQANPKDQLEGLLASGIEVKVGEQTLTVLPEAPGLVTATEYVRSYGSLRYVPVEGEEASDEEADADAKDDAEGKGPKEEVQPSSRQICEAAFEIEKEGELAVAEDPAEDACYLVRFDGVIYPEASEFETSKSYLESRLVREKRSTYIAEWYRAVSLEANPSAAPEPESGSEADETAEG